MNRVKLDIDGVTVYDSGVVVPVPIPIPIPPPTTGIYTAAVKEALSLKSGIDANRVMSCPNGKKTYAYIDTSLYTRFKDKIKWINFAVGTGEPSQTTRMINLDANNDGNIINTSHGKQAWFTIPYPGRFLIEVEPKSDIDVTFIWQ